MLQCFILTDKSHQLIKFGVFLKKIKISLDAMGGDHAPKIVVEGAAEAKVRYPDIEFIFFGKCYVGP